MAVIPSYCTHCNKSFQNNSVYVAPGCTGIRMIGNQTNCPHCNRMVGMMEGKFDVTADDRINMLSGMPPITRTMLEDFDLLTRDAKRYDMDLPVYALQASNIHPSFLHVVTETIKKHPKKSAALSFIIAAISSCNWDGNQLLDQTGVSDVIKKQVLRLNEQDLAEIDSYQERVKQIEKDHAAGKADTTTETATQEHP